MTKKSTYNSLVDELKRINSLASTLGLLAWDEQVNLPPDSADSRARQSSALADIVHRESTQSKIGDWLKELESAWDELSFDKKTVVREVRKDFDRDVKVPAEFVARKSTAQSQAFHAWAKARERSDFSLFEAHLQKQIDFAREEAGYLGFNSPKDAYDYHIDLHDPGMTAGAVEVLFEELKKDLIPLVGTIINSPVKPDIEIFRGFPEDKQELFLREVTARLGFNYKRGRLDRALHPFCSGTTSDTRMTTRFNVDNPLDSLFSSIHETGHGLYQQGLLIEHQGTPLGTEIGMAVHESQSRMWENQVGRSRAFWTFWEPRFREIFKEQLSDVSSTDLYRAVNAVRLNPIRVDSDEVTYNLHIMLRFEIEKGLFYGDFEVADLPSIWKEKSQHIIGLTPGNDAEGVLQDIHWSGGAFGYFPSYCLGNMLAAQLWYTIGDALPDLETEISEGKFGNLLHWLNNTIHHQGKKYDTMEITKRVTGKDLSPKSLIRYLKERYLPIYTEL